MGDHTHAEPHGGDMKKLLFLAIGLLAFALGRPAHAADLGHPAPAHAGDTWTGFYVGGNAGYAWGSANNVLGIADDGSPFTCHFCFASDVGLAQTAGSPNVNPKGFTGGGQLGYNWQSYNWVYGVELDFESFLQSQTVNSSFGLPANTANLVSCAAGGTPTNCVGNFSTSVKADWLFTIRPRVGYTWDQTLVYVTGGLALSKISLSQSYSDNINFGNLTGGSVSTSGSQTKAGWVVGGGIEQALANNWSLKAEYLYVRFDSLSVPTGVLRTSIPGDIAKFTNSVDLSSNIVRVGFNYRFGAFR